MDDIPLSRPMILKAPNEVQGSEFGRVTRAYWLVPLKTIARDPTPRLVIVVAKVKRTTKPAMMVNRSKVDLICTPVWLCLIKSQKSLLARVSTGSDSDLVSDQHAIFLTIL